MNLKDQKKPTVAKPSKVPMVSRILFFINLPLLGFLCLVPSPFTFIWQPYMRRFLDLTDLPELFFISLHLFGYFTLGLLIKGAIHIIRGRSEYALDIQVMCIIVQFALATIAFFELGPQH